MSGDVLDMISQALGAVGWAFLPFTLLPFIYLIFPQNAQLDRFSLALTCTIDSLNFTIGEIVKWALPLLVLSVAFSVFALSIFGVSSTKLFESSEYFHATVIMLGAAATLLAGQHVRVDIFHARMSMTSKAFVDFAGFYVLLLPVCLVIIWSSQSFVALSWQIFEGSAESDGIRGEFLLKTLLPLFGIFMILQGTAIALRAAQVLRGHPQAALPPNVPDMFSVDTMPLSATKPREPKS